MTECGKNKKSLGLKENILWVGVGEIWEQAKKRRQRVSPTVQAQPRVKPQVPSLRLILYFSTK